MASDQMKAAIQTTRDTPSMFGEGSFDVDAVRAALADAPRAPVPGPGRGGLRLQVFLWPALDI